MMHLLSRDGRHLLEEMARERAVLAFDFDGTLAPIVAHPRDACMRARTHALLRAAAFLHPCAVVSGRARADVLRRLSRAPLVAIVGNHGAEAEPGAPLSAARRRVREWTAALRDAIDEQGVEIEDKGLTVAVHYRRAAAPARARRRILRVASGLTGARVFGGHSVVNLAPAEAPTKGDALAALAARFPSRPLVYAGDDETDEDAFRSPAVSVSVRVGRSDASAADWFLEHQAEIDALLSRVLSAHPRGDDLEAGVRLPEAPFTIGERE